MHELGKYLQEQLDDRGWTPAEFARRSGLTPQHISQLLDQKKDRLGRMVEDKTVAGIRQALGVDEQTIITKAAVSMGIPVDRLTLVQMDLDSLSDDVLLELLRKRLLAKGDPKDDGNSPAEKRTSSLAARRRKKIVDAAQPVDQAAYNPEDEPRK